MTYTDWRVTHDGKVKKILDKLNEDNLSREEIINYFMFENMVDKEPSFCLLYESKKKCHDINSLNCLYCACPYFKFNEDGIKELVGNKTLMSECSISSRFKDSYTHENKVHCDCSSCYIPHSKGFSMKDYRGNTEKINDSYSFLEYLRAYQFDSMLGKYKLF